MRKIGVIGAANRETFPRLYNYFHVLEYLGEEAVPLDTKEDLSRIPELSGMIIAGGVDVDPARYGEENLACGQLNPELDELELAAIDRMVKAEKPILGICRGQQILNVYFGGSLIQDVERRDIHVGTMEKDAAHNTRLPEDSFLREIYGGAEMRVNSAHHQAVKKLGKGLVPQQYSEDNVLEGLKHERLPIYCVQWHPERMSLTQRRKDTVDGLPLFEYFIGKLG